MYKRKNIRKCTTNLLTWLLGPTWYNWNVSSVLPESVQEFTSEFSLTGITSELTVVHEDFALTLNKVR